MQLQERNECVEKKMSAGLRVECVIGPSPLASPRVLWLAVVSSTPPPTPHPKRRTAAMSTEHECIRVVGQRWGEVELESRGVGVLQPENEPLEALGRHYCCIHGLNMYFGLVSTRSPNQSLQILTGIGLLHGLLHPSDQSTIYFPQNATLWTCELTY